MTDFFLDDGGKARSRLFDDVYFSAENGLAETMHNFIEGNSLQNRFAENNDFTICETGFGTGLNFLAAWKIFNAHKKNGAHLHFISIEKYPLPWHDIERALKPWRGEFSDLLPDYKKIYPPRIGTTHMLYAAHDVTLTLIFTDIEQALPQINSQIDAWFLDGFDPSKNPQMWSETLYKKMHETAHAQTTFGSFTAAGTVRRGLESAGFKVEKRAGYGRKRHCISGVFADMKRQKSVLQKKKIAIIGAGLAGAGAAFHLNRAGHDVTVFEQHKKPAQEASGNPVGLINPRLSAEISIRSDFYARAFTHALSVFHHLPDIEFQQCGSFFPAQDEQNAKRFEKILANSAWPDDALSLVSAQQAHNILGIETANCQGLWMPDSGTVNPALLVQNLLRNVEVKTAEKIVKIPTVYDAVILANGLGAQPFLTSYNLPLQPIRGQITLFEDAHLYQNLQPNLCFGAYLIKSATPNILAVGSTYDRGDADIAVRETDNQSNLAILREKNPLLPFNAQNIIGRAGLRVGTPDYMPLCGQVSHGLYLSLAHRSHGILSGLYCGAWLAAQLSNRPMTAPQAMGYALDPKRFLT